MRRRTLRASFTRALRIAGAGLVVWAGTACQEPLDTTRKALPKGTLGDDIYGALCDRVGASSFTEDLTGASYQSICHYDENGTYGDVVDVSALPKVSGDKAEEARRLSIAKLELMARRRGDLIRAFNATFPDVEIDDAATEAQGDKIRLHDALLDFSQALTGLYDANPYEPSAEPIVPGNTRSLARLFDAFVQSDPARASLAKVQGRQGYRPTSTILGAIRAALAYPGLGDLGRTSSAIVGPGGPAVPQLQQLLAAAKQELLTSRTNVSALPPLTVDAAVAQPSRPRSNIEVMGALLSREDPSFAVPGASPSYIVKRDRRGFAQTTLIAPFVDGDGDGLADVDGAGRFIDASGAPLAIDPPFVVPGVPSLGPVDPFGRPATPLYDYQDTSRTLGSALARTFLELVDPTVYGAPGDPDGWRTDHESMMFAMAGAYLLYGDREDAVYDHAANNGEGAILPAGQTCANCTPYSRFRGEDSPMADLAHAAGQLLADEDSDAILLSLADLIENHEDVVARFVGAALRAREIAAEHDELAATGAEPVAEMPYETPIWDEVGELLGRMSDRPGMIARLIDAFGDPTLVTPTAGMGGPDVQHVGETVARQLRNRDEIGYDPAAINGPALNVTLANHDDMSSPVNQAQPKTGQNRSIMQRSLQIIHDAYDATACNKEDAELYVLGIHSGTFFITFSECSLFEFKNIATFYVDSILPSGHPKKAQIEIKNGALSFLLDFAQIIGLPVNDLFEDGSGITGLTLTPTTQALNRLVFFGADSGKYASLPDLDPYRGSNMLNEDTNEFIRSLIEPASSYVCPKNGNGMSDCPSSEGLLRIRDRHTIFTWEQLGFYGYLRPVVVAYADEPCAPGEGSDPACDPGNYECDCGEAMFADLIRILNRHWPGPEHGSECSNSGSPATNPRYCSEAGVNTYESLTADVMETDLIPAVVEFSRTAAELSAITVQRGPKAGQVWTGAEVLEKVTRILFSADYAGQVNMRDRRGSPATTWTDGTPQPQVTTFSLFGDALHKIDMRFDTSADPDAQVRKGQWKRARSQLVDAFFAVEGSGTNARFKNPATPKMLLAVINILREQLNANCEFRETGQACTWAKQDLGNKVAETLSGPLFAGIMDVQEALRADEPSRRELERFLTYLLDGAANDASFQSTLASIGDIVQLVANDDVFAPIFQAASTVAAPEGDPAGVGAVATGVKVFKAVTDQAYDPHRVLDHVLPTLVTPMDDGAGPAPIEVFLDVIAEVNRMDSSTSEPLTPEDYALVYGTARDFMTDPTRGLEQLYTIVKNRPRE